MYAATPHTYYLYVAWASSVMECARCIRVCSRLSDSGGTFGGYQRRVLTRGSFLPGEVHNNEARSRDVLIGGEFRLSDVLPSDGAVARRRDGAYYQGSRVSCTLFARFRGVGLFGWQPR